MGWGKYLAWPRHVDFLKTHVLVANGTMLYSLFTSFCLRRYTVINSQNSVILRGGFEDNSTVYCGPPGETLTAVFRDGGGDGARNSHSHLISPPSSSPVLTPSSRRRYPILAPC